MGVSAILARLVSFGEADWIPLWMNADEVEDELSSDDEDKALEITVVLVTELLKHGFIAGDSPVSGDGIRFSAWRGADLRIGMTALGSQRRRHRVVMPKLDRVKEEVGYFKFWLGIVVVTDISLVGWLIVAVDQTDRLRIVLALLAIALLSFGAMVLHRAIDQRMERIGKL